MKKGRGDARLHHSILGESRTTWRGPRLSQLQLSHSLPRNLNIDIISTWEMKRESKEKEKKKV